MTGFAIIMGRIAAVVAATTLAVFVAEFSVRFATPKYDPAGHIAFFVDRATGLQLGKPNSTQRQIKNSGDYDVEVVFNSHGLRDIRDVAHGRMDDLYVLGDSFAFGWGVEEKRRFSNVLETLIGRRVFNIATTANFDGYEKLISYSEAQGAKIRDVVVAINMIDDVQNYEDQIDLQPDQDRAAAHRSDKTIGLQNVKEYLIKTSALYFLATSTISSSDILRRVLVRIGVVKTLKTVSGGLPDRSAVESTARRIFALSQKYNLTILVIPSRGLWVGENRQRASDAHNKFVAALHRRGLNVVDMRPAMQANGDPMQFHFQNDGHWRPRGHALAASILASKLK